MIDLTRELRRLTSTGKAHFGIKQALKSLKGKKAKLLIISSNIPSQNKKKLEELRGDVPIYEFDGTSIELGSSSGYPFPISVITVIDPGESSIMTLSSGRK